MPGEQTVTILFTDLVGSTELLQRAGDEQAQRIFKAHHRLLSEAVQQHGGHEVKWLGDGLMVAFDSAHEAVKCAIAMQQSSRRPAAGERLEIRAGLNVGEALLDESDYFGTPVVVARRLCDRADGGQIFASDVVARLVEGRGDDIDVKELGPLELKGITDPVPAVEIVYEHDPMALVRKLPFVGRQEEYETLLKKLSEAQSGRGSVVLLAGEPGIGKTRLTEEFCEHAESLATVIRGNCYEGDAAAPFGPWLEAFRSLVDQLPDDQLRDAAGPGGPDIGVIVPELRHRLPDLGEPPKLDPESERARLFDSLAAFLRSAAEQRPLVIFLDDLHWCDKPSLALLEQVARGIADRRIVIVGAYRDMEVDLVHPLAQTLGGLRRMEHHERIALRGFSEDSVYDLLHAIEPSEEAELAKRALVTALHAEAQGNPFFMREVMVSLIESGKLVHRGGIWTGTVASIEELGIPEGVKEAIGRRLSGLSEGCNRMLQQTSALRGGFTWDELHAISEDSEDELLDYLDEALGAQLLEERDKLSYAFTHALIRATLYDELSTPRRVRLHRRIAEALETVYADDPEAHLGELAAHYLASTGSDAEKAVEYSIRAGDRARELFAWEEAAGHYQRALEAMPERDDPERRINILLALGSVLNYAGQPSDAAAAYQQVAELARAAGSVELLGEAASGADDAGYFIQQDIAQRLDLIDEALGALGDADSALRARLIAQRARAVQAASRSHDTNLAGWSALLGHVDPEARRQVHEALDMAERVGDHEATAIVLELSRWLAEGGDPGGEARQTAERLVEAASRAARGDLEAWGWHHLFMSSLAQGDMTTVRRAHEEAGRVANAARVPRLMMLTAAREGTLSLHAGRLGDAERYATDAFGIGRSLGDGTSAIRFGGQIYQLRFYQGRLAEVEALWRGIVEQSPEVAIFQSAHALILAEIGRTDEAARLFDVLAARGFARIPKDAGWRTATMGLAEACSRIGDREGVADLYDVMSQHPEGNVTTGDGQSFGPPARGLGLLAAMMRRWDDAERHFHDSLTQCEKLGHRPALTQTRTNYGHMLLQRGAAGDREKGCKLLLQASDAAREMGMAKVQADAERLLGESGSA